MTFDQAQAAFLQHRDHKTAANYLRIARQCEEADTIGDDDFQDALGNIQMWLEDVAAAWPK